MQEKRKVNLKVYLMSSPRNIGKDHETFHEIYQLIHKLGHTHTTSFVLDVRPEEFYGSNITDFYAKTVRDLKQADICIFETTTPSLAIGHLIALAIQFGKPVIALYSGNSLPFFLSGIQDDKIQIINYSDKNLSRNLEDALEFAKDTADTRFNFFVSPNHISYLDWIAKNKKVPRSVYLRELIEKDMESNEEFQNS